MDLGERLKRDFSTMTLVLIPVAIVINIVVGQIVAALRLPVFIDSIGTVLVGILAGPWAGLVTGTLSNLIWGLLSSPDALPWTPVAALIGLSAGLAAKYGFFKSVPKVVIAGIIIMVGSAIASTIITIILFGGYAPDPSSAAVAALVGMGLPMELAVFLKSIFFETIDKIVTAFAAYGIIKGLSVRYLSRFPRPENIAA
jgi:energy-coupling factor transport system substrate-specific component